MWDNREEKGYRNGSRTGTFKTVDGKLEMKKPQIREYTFEAHVFEKYSRDRTSEMWDALIHEIVDKQWQFPFQPSPGILLWDMIGGQHWDYIYGISPIFHHNLPP
jgi:hypothetical protein